MKFFEIQQSKSDAPTAMAYLHGHDYYEMYFLLGGQKKFILPNAIFNLPVNSVAICKPYNLHMFEGGPFKRILISVSPEFLSYAQIKFLDSTSDNEVVLVFDQRIMNKIARILNSLMRLANKVSHDREQEVGLLFGHLLYLMDRYKLPYQKARTDLIKADGVTHPIVLKTVEYINEHYKERISLAFLCDTFHISKTWLCKNFLNAMHCSIANYQLSLRIAKAKELLILDRNRPIDSIACELGFSSAKYFGLAFKKAMNVSPIQYRKLV